VCTPKWNRVNVPDSTARRDGAKAAREALHGFPTCSAAGYAVSEQSNALLNICEVTESGEAVRSRRKNSARAG